MTNEELLAKIKAEIEGWLREYAEDSQFELGERYGYKRLLSFLSTLEPEKPMNMEEAVKWLVDDDYHEASEKGRFILGSVGLGYNGSYIPCLDLLTLPKED